VGGWRVIVAELSYRDAVTAAIRQEMERDPSVLLLGEDVAAAGGVFKATPGLLAEFGPIRVRDTPISEQAIIGLAMGAAMTGLRPIAEIMFSDFLATCWDLIVNQVAKTRYMTHGQISLPLTIRTANGAGLRFGAQHSQSVENWAMAVPGLKVVAPSNPADMLGLLAGAIRDPDPVIVFEHKALYPVRGDVPDGEHVLPLGSAAVLTSGKDATVVAVGAMVGRATRAAELLRVDGIDVSVIDLRSLIPLDTATILESVRRTGWLFTVEENPRVLGWGAEIASIAAEESIFDLKGPITRITAPHVPLGACGVLEDAAIPSVERIVSTIRNKLH
jgi:pyruvate/2-oxoglutarate/acetoin dehydrogenase E1 component